MVHQTRTILLVDNDAEGLDAVRELLGNWGFEVYVARTGQEALTALTTRRPNILLIELRLPGIDGCEIIRRVRAEPTGPHPFVIAYSGCATGPAARAAGADAFVLKPDLESLRHLLGDPEWAGARTRKDGSND